MEIDGKKQLLFDLGDFGEVKPELLQQTDAYFKRSFPMEYAEYPPAGLYPLGLAYFVNAVIPSIFELRRSSLEKTPRQRLQRLTKSHASGLMAVNTHFFRLIFTIVLCCGLFSSTQGILPCAGSGDPDETKPKYRDQTEQINQCAQNVVRKIRAELEIISL